MIGNSLLSALRCLQQCRPNELPACFVLAHFRWQHVCCDHDDNERCSLGKPVLAHIPSPSPCRYYGLMAQRFCLLKREYQELFQDCFRKQARLAASSCRT